MMAIPGNWIYLNIDRIEHPNGSADANTINRACYVLHKRGMTYKAIGDLAGVTGGRVAQRAHKHERRVRRLGYSLQILGGMMAANRNHLYIFEENCRHLDQPPGPVIVEHDTRRRRDD
jgi:hypothetical protein